MHYGLVDRNSQHARLCIALIAKGITNCRFEDTHKESDETVLMKLLELIALILKGNSRILLNNKDIHKMFLLCYRVSSRDRASEMLRSNADNMLALIMLTLFSPERLLYENSTFNLRVSRKHTNTQSIMALIYMAAPASIMHFLCELVCPWHEAKSTCVLALTLISIALEVANRSLGSCPALVSIIQGAL